MSGQPRTAALLLLLCLVPAGRPSSGCADARMRCAYRTGCGAALQQYLTGCAGVLHGENCTEGCQHALIALTSTDEGQQLMTCECDTDELCLRSKQRVETCRASVTRALNRTRVSCRTATWICHADTLCQTALAYYNRLCRSMFQGRKCTPRCRNSIDILTRQEKAARLNSCRCDGAEDYDCRGIRRNMNLLCFGGAGKVHSHGYRKVKVLKGATTDGVALASEARTLLLFLAPLALAMGL